MAANEKNGGMAPPPARRNKKSAAKKQEASQDALPLYEAITSKSASLMAALDQWRSLYKRNKSNGVLAIINMVLQASGCPASISPAQYAAMETDSESWHGLAEHLQAGVAAGDASLYPLIDKAATTRALKRNLTNFAAKLVAQCSQDETLYDGYLLPSLVTWLGALSQHVVRAIRHTGTFVVLQLKAALLQEAARLRSQEEMNVRQLQAEKRKGKKGRADDLNSTTEQLKDHRAVVEEIMHDIYEAIYSHRSRDQDAVIRAECQSALASWIRDYPGLYRNNTFVRNLGWALSDRAPEVRLTAVQELITFFEDATTIKELNAFFLHFRPRIVRLAEDKSGAVAAASFRLNAALAHHGFLEDSHITDLCHYISDEETRVRDAAASFIADYVLEYAVPQEVGEKRAKESETVYTERLREAQLRALLTIVAGSSHPQLPDYLVDALFDKTMVLKSWSTMVNLLRARKLSDSEHILLAKLLYAAVWSTKESTILARSDVRRSNREASLRIDAASVLCPQLATMLSEEEEPEVLSCLVRCAPIIPVDLWADLGLEAELTSLLGHLLRLLTDSHVPDLLQATAEAISLFAQASHKQQAEAEAVCDEAVKTVWGQVLEVVDDINAEPEALLAALNRIQALARPIDVGTRLGGRHEEVERALLPHVAPSADTPVLRAALSATASTLLWHYLAHENTSDRRTLFSLSSHRDQVMNALEDILGNEQMEDSLRLEVLKTVCDLLCLAQSPLSPDRGSWASEPSDTLKERIKTTFHSIMTMVEEEEEDEDDISDTGRTKREAVVAFGRVILSGVLGELKNWAPEILGHYAAHGKSVSAAIRAFHNKLRSRFSDREKDVIVETLRRQYEEARLSGNDQGLRELATRLALSFGLSSTRSDSLRITLASILFDLLVWVSSNVASRQALLSTIADSFLPRLDTPLAKKAVEVFDTNMEGADFEDPVYAPLVEFREALSVAAGLAPKPKKSKKKKSSVAPEEGERPAKKARTSKGVIGQEAEEEEAEVREEVVEDLLQEEKPRGRKRKTSEAAEPEEEDKTHTRKRKRQKASLAQTAPIAAAEEEEEEEGVFAEEPAPPPHEEPPRFPRRRRPGA